MGVIHHQYEFTSTIPPLRLFKAFLLDGDNIVPKITPNLIKNIVYLEGEGPKPGNVQRMSFCNGRPDIIKRYDVVDEDGLIFGYTAEGDFMPLSDKIEKASYVYKLEATPDGGSVIKNKSKYYTSDDVEIEQEKFNAVKETVSGSFRLLETYLNDHPETYN